MPPSDYPPNEKYIARDLSWLSFNERVLEEANDVSNPLLERLKFLAIFVSNLDEFYMVRVANFKNLIDSNLTKKDAFGFYPNEVVDQIRIHVERLMTKLHTIYEKMLQTELPSHKIFIKRIGDLSKEHKKFVREYFETIVYPNLTPLAVDPGHPFPVLPSKTLAFAISVKRRAKDYLVILPVPKNFPRLLRLPSAKDEYTFILIEEMIRAHLNMLFQGYKIDGVSLFRVVRDSELNVDEETTPNLILAIEGEVKKRTLAKPVYLEVEKGISSDLLVMLCEGLKFPRDQVITVKGNLDLSFLFEFGSHLDNPEWQYESYIPGVLEYENIFDKMKEKDFLVYLPYHSFDPTVDLIEEATRDPHVLAIKMTLYRTNKDSKIIKALKEAAQNGKQVTVLFEIRARFDEVHNIRWTRELEMDGCHVIYGVPGLKVHSKMALIVREEEGKIKRYVHLSTGNYNEKTAKLYSDIGFFTANEHVAKDISDLFNVITGFSIPSSWNRIISSPRDLRNHILYLIDREIKFQDKYKNGMILAKLNSLEDEHIINKLYEASEAGVKIRLAVRGICCLVPGLKDLSKNITVKSVVGRFLEHTRTFIFNNNDQRRVFISSADWMKRSFDNRIEILLEIESEDLKKDLMNVFEMCWKDNVKSWYLMPDKTYQKPEAKGESFNFQESMIDLYGK